MASHTVPSAAPRSQRNGLADVLLAWVVLAVVGIEIFVTYTRVPVDELYHVTQGGALEGLSRTLAFAGFPVGLIAIAMLAIVGRQLTRRALLAAGIAVALLAAAVLWPGALDESDIEAPPARLLAAVGVAAAISLTAVAVRSHGPGRLGRERWDAGRLLIGAVILFAALPWLAADLGLSLDSVPLLHTLYQTDVLTRQPGVPGLHEAVHEGHHHGMDGVILALGALLLSRSVHLIESRWLRSATAFYLSFLFVYGLANACQDFWLEQVVKRGWTTAQLPKMLVPSLGPAWAVILILTVVLFAVVHHLGARERHSPLPRIEQQRQTASGCIPR